MFQLQSELDREYAMNQAQTGAYTNTAPMPPSGGLAQRPMTDDETIDHIFTFHDNPSKAPHYIEIREAAKTFARVVNRHVPHGQDKRKAINFIRAAVMWSNAAVALDAREL